MKKAILKLVIEGEQFSAVQGIANPDNRDSATDVTCPSCRRPKVKKTPVADCTQFGFTWDAHTTIFRCKCGCQFYHNYRVWHTEDEKS